MNVLLWLKCANFRDGYILQRMQHTYSKLLLRSLPSIRTFNKIINNISFQFQILALITNFMQFSPIRFANSLGRELTEVDNEITEKLGKSIISPYTKHLTTLGDKVKSSLLRDVHSLAMVR